MKFHLPRSLPGLRIPALLALLTLPFLLAGCPHDPDADSAGVEPTPKARPDPPVAASRSLKLEDGATLIYEVHGSGETAVLLVHCWACNRRYWRHQIEPLIRAGYRVINLNLPGHGAAGREREIYSVEAYAHDVRELADHLKLDSVILVGHSMGGPVSLAAAPLLEGRVLGIVCVDTLHDADYRWPEEWAEQLMAGFENDFEATLDAFIPQMFKPDADPELVEWVREQALVADRDALAQLMRNFQDMDMPALMSGAGVPVRCVNARVADGQGMPTSVENNRRYADYDAVLMDGVGHYPQLEAPAAFNEHFLEVIGELAGRTD